MKSEVISRALLYGALVIVGGVVIWAFTLIGGPAFNRKLALDKNRLSDLNQLSLDIDRYYSERKQLPESLKDLEKLKNYYGKNRNLEDPATKKPYEYKAKDSFSYELCSDFELSSKDAALEEDSWSYGKIRSWKHETGRQCFNFDIPEGQRK